MSVSLKEIELKKHLSELVELCQNAEVNHFYLIIISIKK